MSANPINTAGFYPILGLFHLLTHPKTITGPVSNLSTQFILPTVLKTLLFTSVLTFTLIFSLFHITDHILYLLTRGSKFFPFALVAKNHFIRSSIALLTVAVQAALIATHVVQYFVGNSARKIGSGLLQAKVLSGTATAARSSALDAKEGLLSGNTDGASKFLTSTTSSLTSTTSNLANNVQSEVKDVAQNPKDAVQSLGGKIEHSISKKGIQWAIKKAISIPVEVVPVAGPVIYAALNSSDLGKDYIQSYAKSVGVEKEIESNKRSVQAFGLVAGMLQAVPFVGPIFNFSNFVGSALLVADLKAYKEKQQN